MNLFYITAAWITYFCASSICRRFNVQYIR